MRCALRDSSPGAICHSISRGGGPEDIIKLVFREIVLGDADVIFPQDSATRWLGREESASRCLVGYTSLL